MNEIMIGALALCAALAGALATLAGVRSDGRTKLIELLQAELDRVAGERATEREHVSERMMALELRQHELESQNNDLRSQLITALTTRGNREGV